jgi:hypothetical protein
MTFIADRRLQAWRMPWAALSPWRTLRGLGGILNAVKGHGSLNGLGATMQVELLYFDGCPNWKVAEQRLAKALALVGRDDVTVDRRRVESDEEVAAVGFIGSPTVLVAGHDPFATGGEQVGLACRVYSTPEGLGGSPTVEQLVEVLS